MGADAFIAFYGVRYEIADDETLDALETGRDERLKLARDTKLDTWMGRITDGTLHFFLVGKRLGVFGVEGDHCKDFGAEELAAFALDTDKLLAASGFAGHSRFWFQLEAQH